MTTFRKFPRTLEEAFGPYQRGPIHEKEQRMDSGDKLVLIVCGLISLAMVFMMFAGWLPGGAA